MIDPAIIDALVAAGASAEMIAAAVRADHEIDAAKLEAKRQKNRDRMRSVRDRARTSTHNDAQTRTEVHAKSPSKVPPITPLNTPQGSEPSVRPAAPAMVEIIEPVDEDPKAKLFRVGKTALASFGVAEKRTGSLIGQWLKIRNDPAGLLAAIQYARDQNVAEPVAYISTLINGKPNGNAKTNLVDLAGQLADELRAAERAAGISR